MKLVILAGGIGTRLSEETDFLPKPMVEIGGRPMLWHIMKIYDCYGIRDFVLCTGYKSYSIKQYFADYLVRNSDFTIDLAKNSVTRHSSSGEDWRVTIVDTGESTLTGGRAKRVRRFVEQDDAFCMTYGDGLSSVDIGKLVEFHRAHGKLASMTVVPARARFGAAALENDRVVSFREKPRGGDYINGGFFVLSPGVFDYIAGDATAWEDEPLAMLAERGELMAYRHDGFWEPMDTLRDRRHLESLWARGNAPWKIWA